LAKPFYNHFSVSLAALFLLFYRWLYPGGTASLTGMWNHLLGFFLVWGGAQAYAQCSLPRDPIVLIEEGDPHAADSKLFQSWEVEDSPEYWKETFTDPQSLSTFKTKLLQLGMEVDPVEILKRAVTHSVDDLDRQNAVLALERVKDLVKPVRCLEAYLMGLQADRREMVQFPTEFLSFILRSTDGKRLKIYYYTINFPGIKGVGDLKRAIDRDLASPTQWKVWTNLHNHNFLVNAEFTLGGVCPSAQDFGVYRSFADEEGLEEAWVTNGFHTMRLVRDDFWKFKAK
jgi:hypothetical protein